MTLKEAVQTGLPFKRKDWNNWYISSENKWKKSAFRTSNYGPIGEVEEIWEASNCTFYPEDATADDYQVRKEKIEVVCTWYHGYGSVIPKGPAWFDWCKLSGKKTKVTIEILD